MAYRTKAAVTNNPDTLLCPLCDPRGIGIYHACGLAVPVGRDEARLWNMLESEFPGGAWSVQDRIRGEREMWRGRVDACLYFPLQRWLVVQVDGMTHSKKCMSHKPQPFQLSKDADFNCIALAAQFSVLRLDTDLPDGVWRAALQAAYSPTKCFRCSAFRVTLYFGAKPLVP